MPKTQQRLRACGECVVRETNSIEISILPRSRWKRDGLLVSTMDGVAAVGVVVWRVENGALHSHVHLLPLLW